jgi:cyclopropane-fatty-acyl-phospholipid synthase
MPAEHSNRYALLDQALERELIPDSVLRAGSWAGAQLRERRELKGGVAAQEQRLAQLLADMRQGPIAHATAEANEQHYELPPEFFELVLGPRCKYSGCLWPAGVDELAAAEEAMLALTCERAQVGDGMRVLDLGCGWGSLTLWLAEHYPQTRITAVSNSAPQRSFIERRCEAGGFANVEVITADINEFEPSGRYDRVISIEMFEHMRNWQELLRRISTWLSDDGRLFIHVFSHRLAPYVFEGTWAAERFFTAGLMPSHELPLHFQEDLLVDERWAVPGTHYARTLKSWLQRLDSHQDEVLRIFRASGRSEAQARRMLGSWRLFLISTAVIWGLDDGNRWLVSHYRFKPRDDVGTR